MVSLGKFLSHKRESAVGPLKNLLLAISRTAVQVGSGDRETFQQAVSSTAERITPELESDALESEVAVVIEALTHYNAAVEQRSASQQQELRGMIAAGLDTVAAIAASSDIGVEQLRRLETKLESSAALEDLRALRGKLLTCLTLVRNESVRVQMESQRLVRSLKSSVLRASAELNPGMDGTTGLPGPAALQRLLRQGSESAGERSVAIFVVTDLMAINSRYGRATGDEALRQTSEYLRTGFADLGTLHRWNGPAFVIAAAPAVKTEELKEKARALARVPVPLSPAPLGPTPSRSDGELNKISASLSWMVQALPSGELTEAAVRNLDAFVSQHIDLAAKVP